MRLCHRQLGRWFASYNRRYFGGRLDPETDVFYAPIDDAHALCYPEQRNGENAIVIDTMYAGIFVARGLLMHEMNHRDTGDWTHGKVFQAGMLRLAKLGAFKAIW